MSQFVEACCRRYQAGAVIARYLRVKLSSGTVVVAGASDVSVGTLETAAVAIGDDVPVRLPTAIGTRIMVASGVIAAGANAYAAAGGKIAASGSILVGITQEAAAADNDEIEVLPISQPSTTQQVTPDDSAGTVNTILADVTDVDVQANVNDANDFIVLPALADVPVGHTITVVGNSGANFEVRTPATSNEEINSEDCDGTKEYLFTDTQIHKFVKISNTIGWMGHGFTAIGAVVTAVVPD